MKKFIAFALALVLMLATMQLKSNNGTDVIAAATLADASNFVGNPTIRSRLAKAFTAYQPGTDYFTKNGKACTCHGAGKCVENGSGCNCLRYPVIDGKTVDLLAVQCFGYARYMQYMLFGSHDGNDTTNFYQLPGTNIAPNEDVIRKWFVKYRSVLHTGTHIRIQSGHSISLLKLDVTNEMVYFVECNRDGANQGYCKVDDIRAYTFSDFYKNFHGIAYATVYKFYYSKFPEPPVTMEFVENGEKVTASCGKTIVLPECKVTKEGQKFKGWKCGKAVLQPGEKLYVGVDVLGGTYSAKITAVYEPA